MNRMLSGIVAIATSLSAVKLENHFRSQNVDGITSLVIAIFSSLIIYFILTYLLLHFPVRIRVLRQFLIPGARLEGYWYEQVDKKSNPYSYACIEFDVNSNQFLYYGRNYDISMNLHATFKSVNVQVQQVDNRMHYYFDAQMHSEGKDQITGFGSFTFYKDLGSSFNRGDGYIIDSGSGNIRKIQMVLSRIENKEIKAILGKKSVKSDNDIYKIIENYSKRPEFNRFIFHNHTSQSAPTNSTFIDRQSTLIIAEEQFTQTQNN